MTASATRLRADAEHCRSCAETLSRADDAAILRAIAARREAEAASLEAMERQLRTSVD